MAKLQVANRVMVVSGTYEGRFGLVDFVQGNQVDVVLDGPDENGIQSFLIDEVQKVSPNAGKPKREPVEISQQDKAIMLGSLAMVLLRDSTEPQEFTAKMYNTAAEMGLL